MKSFGKSTGRRNTIIDKSGGPGSYDFSNKNLINNLKGMTIGLKKEHRIQKSVGPTDYSPDTRLSKTQSRAVDFKSLTQRVILSPSPDNGPGTYHNTSKDFGR